MNKPNHTLLIPWTPPFSFYTIRNYYFFIQPIYNHQHNDARPANGLNSPFTFFRKLSLFSSWTDISKSPRTDLLTNFVYHRSYISLYTSASSRSMKQFKPRLSLLYVPLFTPICLNTYWLFGLAPLLRPHCPRMFPRRSTRIHDLDLQRRSARVRVSSKGDWAGKDWVAQG